MENWNIKDKNVLIFDTETSGLNNNYELLSISYSSGIFNTTFSNNEIKNYFRSNTKYQIDEKSKSFEINGLSQLFLEENGIPINELFDKIKDDLNNCDYLIAHNINFDIGILEKEAERNNREDILQILKSKPKLCSMLGIMNTMKLPKKLSWSKDKYGWPSLKEFYKFCFNEQLVQDHKSINDVKALIECITKMFYH